MPRDFSFVHFTDTHIMAGVAWDGGPVDTSATLRRVIETINALEPAPAFAIVGGDLTSPDLLDRGRTLASDEWIPSYRLLREIVDGLRCPTHFLLGNHDDRPAFHRGEFADLVQRLHRRAVGGFVQHEDQRHAFTLVAAGLDHRGNPDLRSFRAHGGKLIRYHGWADPKSIEAVPKSIEAVPKSTK